MSYKILPHSISCRYFISTPHIATGYHYVTGACSDDENFFIKVDDTWYPTNSNSFRLVRGIKYLNLDCFLHLERSVVLLDDNRVSDAFFVNFSRMRLELRDYDLNEIVSLNF